ncbi:MAG: hypothetical protein HS116_18155 [Planctomycetes bacterium]|nr:hypothetical protein [Planctomycetota bacterium]
MEWSIENASTYKNWASDEVSLKSFCTAFARQFLAKESTVKFSKSAEVKINDITQAIYNIPRLSGIATIQSMVARHGMVATMLPGENILLIETIDERWGSLEKLGISLRIELDKIIDIEKDLGKVCYSLASGLALGKSGVDWLYKVSRNHARNEVRILALSVLVNAPRPIDLSMIAPLIANESEGIRHEAMFLCLANGEQNALSETIESLANHTPLSDKWKPIIAYNILHNLGPSGPQLNGKSIPLLKAFVKIFDESKDLSQALNHRIKVLEEAYHGESNKP